MHMHATHARTHAHMHTHRSFHEPYLLELLQKLNEITHVKFQHVVIVQYYAVTNKNENKVLRTQRRAHKNILKHIYQLPTVCLLSGMDAKPR